MGARSTPDDCDREADGPLRRCAVSRAQKPPEELIRFVAGPEHVINLLIAETRAALAQIGAHSLAQAGSVAVRHPGAFVFPRTPPG